MASGPITSWQIDGETMERVTDFVFLGSKITADGDCSLEIKRHLKPEPWRIDAFELWCWRRLLRVPWTARRSNQSILKEISPEYSLEGLRLKLSSNTLAIRCEKLTQWKRLWYWENLNVGGEGDERGWDGWMASQTQGTWVWANSGKWWSGMLQSREAQRVRHDWTAMSMATILLIKINDSIRIASHKHHSQILTYFECFIFNCFNSIMNLWTFHSFNYF